MGIGKRIEIAMTQAGKRPVDIARLFHITESAVSQWFQKDTGPKTERLGELAEFLETTTDYFIRGIEPLRPRRGLSEDAPAPPRNSLDVLMNDIFSPDDMSDSEKQAVLTLAEYLRRSK